MLGVEGIELTYIKLYLGHLLLGFLLLGRVVLCQNGMRFFQGAVIGVKQLLCTLNVLIFELLQLRGSLAEKHRILILAIHDTVNC